MTTHMPTCYCPTCETKLDAATALDESGHGPISGDVTICIYCGEILEFTAEMLVAKVDITTLPIELQDSLVMISIGIQNQRPTLH
jgi:transcription elongation factor Elf1